MNKTMNPINFLDAVNICDYSEDTKSWVASILLEHFNNRKSSIFLILRPHLVTKQNEKIIMVEHFIPITLVDKIYDVVLLFYLHSGVPRYPPDIYLESRGHVMTNMDLPGKVVDEKNLRIMMEYITQWNPLNPLQIIQELTIIFSKAFPLFAAPPEIAINYTGDCLISTYQLTPVSFDVPEMHVAGKRPQEKSPQLQKFFTDEMIKTLLVKELTYTLLPIVEPEYLMVNNHKGKFLALKADYSEKIRNMKASNEELVNIIQLYQEQIDEITTHQEEINEYLVEKSQEDFTMDNLGNYVSVSNPQILKLIAMEATIEELLNILRRGFEKNVFGFAECIKLIRYYSRELFKINAKREKLGNIK